MPAQDEVDSVAAFVEAAEELRASALFDEDRNRMSVGGAGRPHEVFQVDRAQLMAHEDIASAVLPFRRIYMDREPSSFHRVLNILRRYLTDPWSQSEISCTQSIYKSSTAQHMPSLQVSLSPKDTLDMWLNCKLFHSGETRSRGRFSRHQFLECQRQIGPELFEFLFQSAVMTFAICYLNLLPVAKKALADWQDRPRLAPADISQQAATTAANLISRSGPTVQRGPLRSETPAQKFERIMSRRTFDELRGVFEAIGLDQPQITFLWQHRTFALGVAALGWSVEEIDVALLAQERPYSVRSLCDPPTRRKGSVSLCANRRLLVSGDALELLEEHLNRLQGFLADAIT